VDDGSRYTRLGLFVVVSVAILAAGVFALGGRKWFQPTFTFETYFNQSIAGLELGAPVRFRGVPLGHVSEILTSAATYERDIPLERRRMYIVVRVEVNLSGREAAQMRQDAVILIRRGLRAQTQLAGVTGQQYLALDFLDAAKYPPLAFDWTPRYTYVPSAPSIAGEIIAKAQVFLASLNDADIKALGRNLNTLMSDLDTKIGSLPVAQLAAQAHEVLGDADHTLRKLAAAATTLDALASDPSLKNTLQNVAVISGRLRKAADDGGFDRTLKGIDEAAERLDVLLADNQNDVRGIVEDLRVTAANVRGLSESLKRYPAGALFGPPPARIELPGGVHGQ